MTNQTKHTPTPWRVSSDDKQRHVYILAMFALSVAETHNLKKQDAEFIVKAVNSHDELLEACKLALECHKQKNVSCYATLLPRTLEALEQAIAKAEGK